MENLRFDLTLCDEVNDFLKEIRKTLKEKGYIKKTSRSNCYIGTIHFWSITEYFIKGNTMFEIERDLENNSVGAVLHYYHQNGEKEHKNIRLADIKDFA